MTVYDEYETKSERNIESDNEMIPVLEDSKTPIDLSDLQIGKNIRIDDLKKKECVPRRNLSGCV